MSRYSYSQLRSEHNSIRLLRLLPSEDDAAEIQCELFEYPLHHSRGNHLYEALSYVWGEPADKLPILMHGHSFSVTVNLHAALQRLRNHVMQRILWVDALCINQDDQEEKEHQIQAMTTIYGKASRVIVWLGEAADDSDKALEDIRIAGDSEIAFQSSYKHTERQSLEGPMLALLQRPWFYRIWILQEVGAARHVLITCGSEEIDGYAFCAGLASFHGLYDTRSNSRPPIASVIHLIMGAIFRPKGSHQLSHGICTLGALLDMYHSREASVQHDKVYALLGMSVDGTSETSLSPNYNLPWEELFGNLVRFLLHKEIRVETSPTRGHILIKGAVSVLGSIYGIRSDASFEQTVEIMWRDVSNTDDHDWTPSSVWSFRLSATPIMEGDIICLFAGASLPTIVRVSGDYCFIVQIAPIPPTKVTLGEKEVDWPKLEEMARHLPTKNLQCVWEWATLREPLQSQEESVESMIEAPMVSGLWNSMLMSFEAGVLEAAESMFRRLMWACERFKEDALYKAIADQLFRTPDIDFRCIQQESVVDPLIWASSEGFLAVVDLLIRRDAGAVNSVGFQLDTALTSAAAMGHVEIVKRLLQEKPELNLFALVPDQPRHGIRTALQAAAERGHFEVVEALIKDKADVNAAAAESSGRTALQAAAGGGHFAIVERLLQAGADVNAHAALEHGRTALQAAAEGGYTAIVEYLLQENAATNTPLNLDGTTALAAAVDAGSLTIVDMLLRKGADVHAKDHYSRTALHRAAYDGVLAIVERLLEAQSVVDARDSTMRTALHITVEKSHPEIVKRLIEAGADVNAKASSGNVLVVAKRQGDENIIVMLRQAGAVGGVPGDVISKNYYQI